MQELDPTTSPYLPLVQRTHSSTLDAVEYLPTAHGVQMLAPARLPLSVTEPATHGSHDATSELSEYSPFSQAMHSMAPAALPVFVLEPGRQV